MSPSSLKSCITPTPDSSVITPETLHSIRTLVSTDSERIFCLHTDQGSLIVKGQRPARSALRYRLLNILAGILRVPLARSVPAWGGIKAQQIELRRLHALLQQGLPVPQVRHVEENFFVMDFLGGANLAYTMASNPDRAVHFWRMGGNLLLRVHNSGQYLSQAFARNFIVHGDQLGLIDFEDDPLEVMSLEEAQTRDWLAYLYSTIWLLPPNHSQILEQLTIWMSQTPYNVGFLLRRVARQLSRLRHLPRSRKPWGREIVSIQALAQLLHQQQEEVVLRMPTGFSGKA